MSLKKSLNEFANWQTVLACLDIETRSGALPQRVVCPLCHGHRLMIFADQVYGGSWASCCDCGFSGDMIELCSRAGNIDIPATVSWLQRWGAQFPTDDWGCIDVPSYMTDYIQRRKRCSDLVARGGRDLVPRSATIWDIVCELGLVSPAGGRIRRIGGFAMPTDAIEINQLVRPRVKNQTAATSGGSRVLHGRGWREVIAIPCWDLPGRLSGFLILGWIEDRLEQQFMSLHAPSSTTRNGKSHPPVEAGLTMLPALFDVRRHADISCNAAFVMDPLEALWLQARHLLDHSIPLPLVGAIDMDLPANGSGNVRHAASRDVFHTILDRHPLVFCDTELTPALLRMAAGANGRIWLGQVPRRRFSTWPWLRRVEQESQPWQDVFVEAMARLAASQREEFVAEVGFDENEWRIFLSQLDAARKGTLRSVPQLRSVIESAVANGHPVIETDQGWFERDTGKCVSTARLRIDRVYSPANGGEPYYAGRILQGEAEVPFLSPMDEVERRTFWWMTCKLVEAGHPPPEYLSHYSGHATQIAPQLHAPELRSAGRFGFERGTWRMVLPQFTIDIRGRLRIEESPIWDDMAPAINLPPPAGISDDVLRIMTVDTPCNRVFWATAAYLAANILWDAHGPRPKPIGFVGRAACEIGTATAAAFGCATVRLPPRPNSPLCVRDAIERASARHNWPVLLCVPPRLRPDQLTLSLNWDGMRSVVLATDIALLLPAIEEPDRWHLVQCEEDLARPSSIAEFGPLILSNWLFALGQRKFQVLPHGVPLPERVLEDFARWVGGRGDAEVVREAAEYWVEAPNERAARRRRKQKLAGGDEDDHSGLGQELCRLVESREGTVRSGLGKGTD